MATNNATNTSNPVTVAQGGTGVASNTAYAVLCGGTTSTGAVQSIAGVGTSGQVLTSNGAGALPTFQAASGGSQAKAVYGTGVDGSVTFDGSSTVLGLAPSSSIYTLNRDIFLSSGTINNGVSIKTNGFRIFCNGTLTNNGTIFWNGGNANANTSAGSGPSNANSTFQVNTAAGTAPGTTGGASAQNSGNNGTAATNHAYGGAGGAGGAGSFGGGSGGTATGLATGYSPIYALPYCVMLREFKGDGTNTYIQGGTGGGGGGGDSFTTNSGCGGGGGGIVFVAAYNFAGTGTLQAKGGNGGNGVGVVGPNGGGGGGGGGLVVAISSSVSGGAISGQTIDVSGGSGGAAGPGGGSSGSTGSTGNSILINP